MAIKKTKKTIEKSTIDNTATTNALFAVTSLIAAYVLGTWAIDSGSLIVYGLTFGAVYAFFYYSKLFIRVTFFNNDESTKAKYTKR